MNSMLFWVLTALMLACAMMCILVPLARKTVSTDHETRAGIYENQLRELEAAGGSPDDDEYARIAKRLLRARSQEDAESQPGGSSRTSLIAVSLGGLLFIPLFTGVMYASYGAPGFDDGRQAAVNTPVEQQSVDQLVAAAEKQLEKNPDDLRGWTVVASVYGRNGDFQKRANALTQILRLSGPNADLLAELGEAQALANGGVVSQQALDNLAKAVALEPNNTKARAYRLLAKEQEGRFGEALEGWRVLKADVAGEKTWEDRVNERITALEKRLPVGSPRGPTREQISDAAALPGDQRQAMIEGMVANLAQRLEDEPDDLEGWLRLLRSYHVLGEREAFAVAWRTSSEVFKDRPDESRQLMEAAQKLGYEISQNGSLKGVVSQ